MITGAYIRTHTDYSNMFTIRCKYIEHILGSEQHTATPHTQYKHIHKHTRTHLQEAKSL